MKFTIGSAFRNSRRNGQLARYFTQVVALERELTRLGHSLFVIAAEGDSTDDTAAQLDQVFLRAVPGIRVDVSHGGPVYGSTEAPERMKALQGVGNGILGNVPIDTDVLIYVESDLVWDPSTIVGLIEKLCDEVDIVAPLVYAGELFYDVFAFRNLQGERFSPFPPYSNVFARGSFAEVGSVGSCLVMKAEVARSCRIGTTEGLVSFCRVARSRGYQIWVDSESSVRHL